MNTRLQVEHPVTEAVTGLDLVEWQLRVASGERLPQAQAALRQHGHAIEARICAESPEHQFMPATGTLHRVRWPAHVEFETSATQPRVDSGVREGDAISPYYDSMIAKLIVWGADRAQALARLDAALSATHLLGLATNVAFLRRVVGSRAFATADLDTALIEREHAALFETPPLAPAIVAAAVVAHVRAEEAARQDADPWSRRDAWRLHGSAERRIGLKIDEQALEVTVHTPRPGTGPSQLRIGGQICTFASLPLGDGRHELQVDGRRCMATVLAHGARLAVYTEAGSAQVTRVDPGAARDTAADEGRLTAPMPGKVVGFLIRAGERVQRGQALAVMEAMKMEHTLTAPHDGVVEELLYAVGDQVAEGGALLRMAAG